MEYSLLIFVTCIFMGLGRVEGIVEGSPAGLGEFPYMVAIIREENFYCGGALISDRHVLTAAHCVRNHTDPNHSVFTNFTVKVGTIDRTDPTTGIRIEVDKVVVHPEFVLTSDPLDVVNDIAVLTLKEPVTESEFVKPIALPEAMEEYPQDTQFIFSGYGSKSIWIFQLENLQKFVTSAVSPDNCQFQWTDMTIRPGHLCAAAGACLGDSGGPLTIDGKVLVGIESASDWDCGPQRSNVYTKVSHYLDFIRKEMDLTDKPPRPIKLLENVLASLLHDLTMLLKGNI